jgi:hypothetical protein
MNADAVKEKPNKNAANKKKQGGGAKQDQAGGKNKPAAEASGDAPAPKTIERRYDDPERIREFVDAKKHRSLVGSAWEAMGDLQLKLLMSNGLLPEHIVLDIGCGCLRAGVKIIPYLEPDHYFGIEWRQALMMKAGYRRELARAGLETRLSRENLCVSLVAQHARLKDGSVDVGLCIGVMSHQPLNFLRIMLENAARYFKTGAKLYVSFYELAEGEPFAKPFLNKAGTRSRGHKPPFHYYRRDMEYAAKDTQWTPNYVGYWGEPDGQYLMVYEKI